MHSHGPHHVAVKSTTARASLSATSFMAASYSASVDSSTTPGLRSCSVPANRVQLKVNQRAQSADTYQTHEVSYKACSRSCRSRTSRMAELEQPCPGRSAALHRKLSMRCVCAVTPEPVAGQDEPQQPMAFGVAPDEKEQLVTGWTARRCAS